MTDPAMPPDSSATGQQLNKVFLLAAATDLLTGLVLVGIGLRQDETTLTLVGLLLALGGTAVVAWLIVRGNRPTQL